MAWATVALAATITTTAWAAPTIKKARKGRSISVAHTQLAAQTPAARDAVDLWIDLSALAPSGAALGPGETIDLKVQVGNAGATLTDVHGPWAHQVRRTVNPSPTAIKLSATWRGVAKVWDTWGELGGTVFGPKIMLYYCGTPPPATLTSLQRKGARPKGPCPRPSKTLDLSPSSATTLTLVYDMGSDSLLHRRKRVRADPQGSASFGGTGVDAAKIKVRVRDTPAG
ncbi:MAG: hypothetical protein AAF721_07960 [Myxococcota bacterium]